MAMNEQEKRGAAGGHCVACGGWTNLFCSTCLIQSEVTVYVCCQNNCERTHEMDEDHALERPKEAKP